MPARLALALALLCIPFAAACSSPATKQAATPTPTPVRTVVARPSGTAAGGAAPTAPSTTPAPAAPASPTSPGGGGSGNGGGTGGSGAGAGDPWVIVFASNLESRGGCHDGDRSGCDLFAVDYNPGTGAVSNLQRLTAEENIAEWAPSLSPDGCWLAYNRDDGANLGAAVVHSASGAGVPLDGAARFPAWSADGASLAWSESASGQPAVVLAQAAASCAAGTIEVSGAERVPLRQPVSLARFAPTGSGLVLQFGSGASASLGVLSLADRQATALPATTGFVAPAVSPNGEAVAAANPAAGSIVVVDLGAAGSASAPRALAVPQRTADFASFDPRYAACAATTPGAPGWMGDTSVLYEVECGVTGSAAFSHIFLAHADGSAGTIDISALVEEMTGSRSKDFITPVAIPLRAAGGSIFSNV